MTAAMIMLRVLRGKTGEDCNSKAEWTFPSGAKLEFDCVINVTTPGGGDSTNVDSLEFDLMSDGKPTYTPEAHFKKYRRRLRNRGPISFKRRNKK